MALKPAKKDSTLTYVGARLILIQVMFFGSLLMIVYHKFTWNLINNGIETIASVIEYAPQGSKTINHYHYVLTKDGKKLKVKLSQEYPIGANIRVTYDANDTSNVRAGKQPKLSDLSFYDWIIIFLALVFPLVAYFLSTDIANRLSVKKLRVFSLMLMFFAAELAFIYFKFIS